MTTMNRHWTRRLEKRYISIMQIQILLLLTVGKKHFYALTQQKKYIYDPMFYYHIIKNENMLFEVGVRSSFIKYGRMDFICFYSRQVIEQANSPIINYFLFINVFVIKNNDITPSIDIMGLSYQ